MSRIAYILLEWYELAMPLAGVTSVVTVSGKSHTSQRYAKLIPLMYSALMLFALSAAKSAKSSITKWCSHAADDAQ